MLLVVAPRTHLVLGATVTPLPCRYSVATAVSLVQTFAIGVAALVEVLACVHCASRCRSIEVVEHQVHIGLLLPLKVVLYIFVSVNLDLYVLVSNFRECSRLFEMSGLMWLLFLSSTRFAMPHLFELMILRPSVIADVEGLPANAILA